MVFNTFFFILFFPIVFAAYHLLQTLWGKTNRFGVTTRNIFFLIVSYGTYISYDAIYAIILLAVTIASYTFALFIAKTASSKTRKWLFFLSLAVTLSPLFVFKYYDFALNILNDTDIILGISCKKLEGLNWALPLGISFYTLQAIGYLYDVYYKKSKVERDFSTFMLFICFFPQIVSGPISRANELIPQLKARYSFDYSLAVKGLKWLLWGCFMKVVVADRLGLFVNEIFDNYQTYSGTTCTTYAILYAIQIYCDFAGYSYMAIGTGALLGFRLTNNFRHPYLATSVTDFWHRWHISLSTWLRDYIYIPLKGSRCSNLRNSMNILLTFIVSGIWHGANWNFVVWGLLHGLLQVIEKRTGIRTIKRSTFFRIISIIITFVLIDIAWVFFRMPTITDATSFLSKIISSQDLVFKFPDKIVLFFVALVLVADCIEEYLPTLNPINSKYVVVRWSSYLLLLLLTILFGVFDSSQFIYARF